MAESQRDVAKERYWRDVVRRHAASGLSVRTFCLREELTKSAFYAWRRTIGERDGNRTPTVKTGAVKGPAFVPVTVTGESRRDAGLVIELVGGRVLRLPESIAAQRLAELVAALEVGMAR
jgi:transposase-like protein